MHEEGDKRKHVTSQIAEHVTGVIFHAKMETLQMFQGLSPENQESPASTLVFRIRVISARQQASE